jgi:hypothetical protein
MFIVRILFNLLVLAFELAAIVGVAALGFFQPMAFAAVTFVLALVLGARLEYARLKNELNFYFEGKVPVAGLFTGVVALSEALFKAVLAGLVALLTFSGTDQARLYWVAIVVAVAIFAGSSLLRFMANRFNATPARWGYFRIAVPLGLIFSAALSFLPVPTFGKIGWDLVANVAAKPTLKQASELLFMLTQKFDETAMALLQTLMSKEAATVIAVAASVNMLTGFVLGIYAVVIAQSVKWLEDHGP